MALSWRPTRWTLIAGLGLLILLPGKGMALQRGLPPELPPREELASWERVRGTITTDLGETFDYEFYVNPARGAIYTITHYRLRHAARAGAPAHIDTEKLIWNQRPGERVPLRLFERVGERWYAVPAGTGFYLREMQVVMALYRLHSEALQLRDAKPQRPAGR